MIPHPPVNHRNDTKDLALIANFCCKKPPLRGSIAMLMSRRVLCLYTLTWLSLFLVRHIVCIPTHLILRVRLIFLGLLIPLLQSTCPTNDSGLRIYNQFMITARVSPLLMITSFMFEALVISQCLPLLMVWTNIFNSKMSCMCQIFGGI